MARDPDDDALSWGDESDPTYAEWYKTPGRRGARPADELGGDELADDEGLGDDGLGDDELGDEGLAESSVARAESSRSDGLSEAEKSGTRSGTATEDAFAASTGAPAWSRSVTPDSRTGEANEVAVGRARAAQAEAAAAQSEADEDEAADADLADAEKQSEQLSSAALIVFGIIGGVFLLYTVGWLVVFLRTQLAPTGLAEIVQDVQGILTVAAPALWFIVTLLLAARRRVPVRIIWLLIGIIVLVPWPFITGN